MTKPSTDGKRMKSLRVLCTEEESLTIQARADAADRSVSDFLRRLGLGLEAPAGPANKAGGAA